MVMELHPGTPTQIEEATRRLARTASSARPLTPQMQAEVDALVFKPQRQIPTAGFDFLPRRPLYHQSTPQRKASTSASSLQASASAGSLPRKSKPKLSHQTTTPVLIRPVPEGHADVAVVAERHVGPSQGALERDDVDAVPAPPIHAGLADWL